MKVNELFSDENKKTKQKAKKIVAKIKQKLDKSKNKEGDIESNWLGNQFMGNFDKMRMTR